MSNITDTQLKASDGASLVGFEVHDDAAAIQTVEDRLKQAISLTDFGFVADGLADDTDAWKNAIAAAKCLGVGLILVPWGECGVSRVTDSIVDGPMPSGLTFQGLGRGGQNDQGASAATLRYEGSDACWRINFPDFAGNGYAYEVGRWTWRNLTFEATDGAGTMFDFNDVLNHGVPVDNADSSVINHVRFESCHFYGAGAGGDQSGDAIRGIKCFTMVVDENCYFRDWRRAWWLKGSDNNQFRARAYLNARNVMLELSGTFGNNNEVDCPFLGAGATATSEDAYNLWDHARATVLRIGLVEDGYTETSIYAAMMYLDGYATEIDRPLFNPGIPDRPLFRLGPNARDILMIGPNVDGVNVSWAPIIDTPTSTDFGVTNKNYRMRISDAGRGFQLSVGSHPRLVYSRPFPLPDVPADQAAAMLADARGLRPRLKVLSALNYWAYSEGTPANDGIGGFVEDDVVPGGWAIWLDRTKGSSPGISFSVTVGEDVMPGDLVLLRTMLKYKASAGWYFKTYKNGVEATAPGATVNGGMTDFEIVNHVIDLASWEVGDELRVTIHKGGSPDDDLYIGFFALGAVEPAIPDPTTLPEALVAIASIINLLEARGIAAPA